MAERPKGFMTDAEFTKAYKAAFGGHFDTSFKHVREMMQEQRSRAKDGAKVVAYTQGQHTAIARQFAAQQAAMMTLLEMRSLNRARMVKRIQQLEAKVEAIEAAQAGTVKRLPIVRAKAG